MNDKWLKFEVFVKDGKFLEDLHTLLQKYNMYPQYLAVHTPGKQTSACCPSCEAYRPVKVVATVKAEFPLRQKSSDGTEYIDPTEGKVLYTEDFPEIVEKAIKEQRFCERCNECLS